MKKLFTLDDFMIAFVSALGYGYGEVMLNLFGWPEWLVVVVSLVVGIAMEELISAMVFSKTVQKDPRNKFVTYISILFIFLFADIISNVWLKVSMLDNLVEEFLYVVGLPIIGFVINLCIRAYHILKVRKVYDDGSKGFVFDVSKKEVEDINQHNQQNLDEYDADCAVKIRTGIYVGEKEKNNEIISYYGIPYAKAPVGELRWKAPEPLPASQEVFEATNFGDSAVQVEHKGVILKLHKQSEDCLSLNIYIANDKKKEKKPVVVLFHNGDFSYGGSADPLVYGDNFVKNHKDVVFVSFNYRLGIFGFIDFSDVPGGEAYPDTLNLGLLDQIAALEWVKENISAFGGDPDRVTVMGFESGAVCVCMLAACEKAKGLFQKAFVFDGNPEMIYNTPDAARTLAKKLLEETHTNTMEELLRLDTQTLKQVSTKLWQYLCTPTYDKNFIPVDIYNAYQNKAASGIEFIVGIPSNEGGVMRSYIGNNNYEKLLSIGLDDIRKYIDDATAAEIREYIESNAAVSSELEAKSKFIDQWIAANIYRSAVKLAEGGNKVHLMYWDEKPLIKNLGSGSVDVMAVLLGNDEALELYGNVMNKDMSEIMQALLQKFIKGDPLRLYTNEILAVDAINWKPYPKALIVKNKKIKFDTIKDKLTVINNLLKY